MSMFDHATHAARHATTERKAGFEPVDAVTPQLSRLAAFTAGPGTPGGNDARPARQPAARELRGRYLPSPAFHTRFRAC